ncbi:hypothetical protein DXG01_007277 [Tephrocybe rancida]|nr:hypothetical protein DXG01_007277 [Tephrocybe rancida]
MLLHYLPTSPPALGTPLPNCTLTKTVVFDSPLPEAELLLAGPHSSLTESIKIPPVTRGLRLSWTESRASKVSYDWWTLLNVLTNSIAADVAHEHEEKVDLPKKLTDAQMEAVMMATERDKVMAAAEDQGVFDTSEMEQQLAAAKC